MNGKHYIGRRAVRFENHGDIRAVEGVALVADEEHEYRAGDMDGCVLEIACPYGTQAMAEDLLAQLRGKTYTGYRAENAVTDPAAELGDGVTVGGIYSLLASREVSFGSGHLGQISAPAESDLDHEYAAADSYTRQIGRKLAAARSYIDKKSDEIRLGVEGVAGDVAELAVSVGSLSGTVSDHTGRLSTVEQTAGRLRSDVNGLDSRVSTIEQTESDITMSVTGSLGGKASIKLSNGSGGTIDLSTGFREGFAKEGGAVNINTGKITFNSGTFAVNSDNFTVTENGSVTASNATLDHVTFTKHEAGTFPAPAQIIQGNAFLFPMSGTSSWSLYGNAGDGDLCIATVSKLDRFYGGSQCIVIGWDDNIYLYCGENGSLRADKSLQSTSDRDKKRNIEAIDERYLAILDEIGPVRFKYVGQDEPAAYALGYIAQDVEAALLKAGLTRGDFAGLSGEDGTGCMALSYDDFVPLLHLKINALERRIRELEERI